MRLRAALVFCLSQVAAAAEVAIGSPAPDLTLMTLEGAPVPLHSLQKPPVTLKCDKMKP